jgi:hypothetical protein
VYRRRRHLNRGVVTALFLLLLLLTASPAVGFDLPEPDHGIEEDEFDRLWSGYGYDSPSEDASANDYLTKASDYAYAEPPAAPDTWNEGEAEDFFGGSDRVSQYPPDTELSDGEAVKDAYVRIFDVSGSTRVLFSPQREVLYVPSDGEVRGFTDYRIEGDDVIEHSVEVELVETDQTVTGNGGFSVPYDGLSGGPGSPELGGESTELTLRATVTATRQVENDTVTETVTVEDSIEVEPYNPARPPPIAVYGQYPNEDTSLFFLREAPWSSVTLADGTKVQSNWRFFSARAEGWGNMQLSTSAGESVSEDVYHPLRVYAYPSRSGVYVDGDAKLRNVIGDEHEPPSLSEELSFDLPRSEYTAVQGFDLRHEGDAETGNIQLNGIVSGSSVDRPPFPSVKSIRTTNLELNVVEVSDDAVEVEVSLRDSDGNPVDTRRDDGIVRVDGHGEVNTGIDGTATVEISPPPSGAVVAEYVPVNWYEAETEATYVGDRATVNPNREYSLLGELGMLSQLVVFLLPFLVSVYFIDRTLGLGIWPPWGKI